MSKNADMLMTYRCTKHADRRLDRLEGAVLVRGSGWPAWPASYLNYCIPPAYSGAGEWWCTARHVHAVISIGLPRIVTFEARGHRLVATATSALAAIGCSSAAHCSCLEWREICITASGVYGPRPVRGLQLPVTLSIESTVDVR